MRYCASTFLVQRLHAENRAQKPAITYASSLSLFFSSF